MPGVLGLDVGAHAVTAVVADIDTGRPLGATSEPLRTEIGEGGLRHQHPDRWWDAATRAVRTFDGMLDVRAIAVAGQPQGLVCVGRDGNPLGSATLWNDTSAAVSVDALTNALGGVEAVRALIGMDLHAGMTAVHVARLRDTEPERFAATARFCLAHDFVTARLVGEPVTDAGDASTTGYFDTAQRQWSSQMLEAIAPDGDLRSRLPPLAPAGVALGPLRRDAARRLQLSEGIAVANGTGEPMAAAVAMGLFAGGRVGVLVTGGLSALAHSPVPATDPEGAASAWCDATGNWLPSVGVMNGVTVLHRVAEMLATDLGSLEAAAGTVAPGAGGLAFLPYVDGERTPPRPEGSAAIVGLHPGLFSPAHLARAAYDGIVLALALTLPALARAGVGLESVAAAGPGARSPLLRKTIADVLGRPVRRVPADEPAAWGAAALAAWALTGEPVQEIVRRWWRGAGPGAVSVTDPDPAVHEVYAAALERHRDLAGRLFG